MSLAEDQQELAFLTERIAQLRNLQHSQKHLPFVSVHLQEHIDKLQARIDELGELRRAS